MSLQNILDTILADATEQSEAVLTDARNRVREISENAEKKAEEAKKVLADAGENKIAAMHQKVENLIAHREKSEILSAKREILTSALDSAKKTISQKSPAEKEKIFVSMLEQISAEKGEIRPVAADADILKKALSVSKKPFSLGKEISGRGGFVFVSPSMEMDFRIEEIVDRLVAPRVEEGLSHLLF